MKVKILYIISLTLLLWSCTNEDERNIIPEISAPIEFQLSFATNKTTANRIITAPDFSSLWQTGDKVGVYIAKGNSGLQSRGNYVDNLELEYNGSQWTSNRDTYFPNDGEDLHFYAYYPYQDNENQDATALHFAIKRDQRSDSYNANDLLIASKTDVSKSATRPVQLQFYHAMALVQIEVEKEEFVPELTDDFVVRMIFVQSDININLETGKIANNPDTYSDIIMHKVADMPQTYRALVPAQKLTLYSKVKFSQNSEGAVIDMDYLGLIQKEAQAGTILKRKITLGREEGFESLQQYKVGDYYPDPDVVYENKNVVSGTPATGIVFWLEPNTSGTHGLVASLDEARGTKWSLTNMTTHATDIDNGLENMQTIEQYIENTANAKWSDFPAFNWVHTTKNGGNARYEDEMLNVWYIPARLELKKLFAAFSGKTYEEIIGWGSTNNMPGYNDADAVASRTAFNNKLKAANGMDISIKGTFFRYWSSSEFDSSQVWATYFSNGYTLSTSSKTSGIYTTRSVFAF